MDLHHRRQPVSTAGPAHFRDPSQRLRGNMSQHSRQCHFPTGDGRCNHQPNNLYGVAWRNRNRHPDVTNTIFTFTPSGNLALSTTYTATISAGATDSFGNALASNFVWTFATATTTCTAPPPPPTVISVTPPSGTAGVCPNTIVTATFSETMNPASIDSTTFTLTG